MRFNTTRKTADIVNDNNGIVFPVLPQPGEHRLHAGAICELAGHIIGKHLFDSVLLERSELPAAALLRPETVAPLRLRLARHAAIDRRRSASLMIFVTRNHSMSMRSRLGRGMPLALSCSWFDPTSLNAS